MRLLHLILGSFLIPNEYAWLFAMPLILTGLVFWINMLDDCATHERGKERMLWTILLLIPGFAGMLIYYFSRWLPRHKTEIRLN
jgi:hypothetical protein